MKQLKKRTVFLAVFMAVLLAFGGAVPCFAAEYPHGYPNSLPVNGVIVRGAFHSLLFESAYLEDGSENPDFFDAIVDLSKSESKEMQQLAATAALLVEELKNLNIAGVKQYGIQMLNDFFGAIGCNPDGTPKRPTYNLSTYPHANYTDPNGNDFTSYGMVAFDFDWRLSPMDNAVGLHTFLAACCERYGVDAIPVSFQSGSAPLCLAYLALYGTQYISKLIIRNGFLEGSSFFGDLVNKEIWACPDAALTSTFLKDILASDDVAPFLQPLKDITDMGWLRVLSNTLLVMLSGFKEDIYKEAIIPSVLTMPFIWSLVPADRYESGIRACFGDDWITYSGLIAKTNEYQTKVAGRARELLALAAEVIPVALICSYGSSLVPVTRNANINSDTICEVSSASLGATASLPGQTLSQTYGGTYTQAQYPEHNYISPDLQIDASTCMFPETTWFINNANHFSLQDYEWLWWYVNTEDATVFSDPEHPQFVSELTPDSWTDALQPQAPAEEPAPPTFWEQVAAVFFKVCYYFNYIWDWWIMLFF
ncbi:MAG: hypothetical protein LBR73_04280 [Oscillospiraceae bacterium]|jgi:hypothetical protein|nr:hypothetical protein [Oscillospiraceae bacterium]